jgi:hypothetical protein
MRGPLGNPSAYFVFKILGASAAGNLVVPTVDVLCAHHHYAHATNLCRSRRMAHRCFQLANGSTWLHCVFASKGLTMRSTSLTSFAGHVKAALFRAGYLLR